MKTSKEYCKEYRIKHKETIKKNQNKYREKNREKIAKSQREYYKLHRKERISYTMKKRFGITLEQYSRILKEQNGVCAICGNKETHKHQSGKIKELAIDHNHITGKVRGLLCERCNHGLGKFNADSNGIELLCSAISYLRNTDNV